MLILCMLPACCVGCSKKKPAVLNKEDVVITSDEAMASDDFICVCKIGDDEEFVIDSPRAKELYNMVQSEPVKEKTPKDFTKMTLISLYFQTGAAWDGGILRPESQSTGEAYGLIGENAKWAGVYIITDKGSVCVSDTPVTDNAVWYVTEDDFFDRVSDFISK